MNEVASGAAQLGLDATFREPSSLDHLGHLVNDAYAQGHRKFISVGGDGTAHWVLNALMADQDRDRCALGVVPVGSGNDFVRTFGHGSGVHTALVRINDPDLYTIDVGRIEGSFGVRWFLNALNLGVAAASASTAGSMPRWMGSAKYTTAFWIALSRFSSGHVDAQIGRHRFKGEAINVVVANGQFFGGGLNIAPRSILTDGKFDVQVFSGPRRQAFAIMPRILVGAHLTHRAVRRYTGSSMRIDVPDRWPVEADGEILGRGGVKVQVLPQAIDFVV